MCSAASAHVECRQCGAAMQLPVTARTAVCPYCAAPSVVERPRASGFVDPTFAMGFVFEGQRARALVRDWALTQGFFREPGVRRARVDELRGVYLPAYLYSAVARSRFSALIGEDYTETETYTATNAQGKTETRTRTVTRTEHRPLRGEHAAYVADVLVTASRALGNAELGAVEPFDLRAIRRYDPSLVAGWIAEDPSMTSAECIELARREAVEKVGASLHDFMPGDSHRELVHQTWLEQESLDLVLVPVWVLALRYRDDRGPLRVLVNGQTGRVAGAVPWSRRRIAVAVAAVVLAVVAAVLAATYLEPAW
jgi:hypothetical protein